tara:strand:+ start:517 stop:765 length:249 start_codon:yes stop_codon:yes gene_type:complete
MNKTKLVELAEEVFADIDVEMESLLREKLEEALAQKLYKKFNSAYCYHWYSKDKEYKKDYESVKPILNEAIDKVLARRVNNE